MEIKGGRDGRKERGERWMDRRKEDWEERSKGERDGGREKEAQCLLVGGADWLHSAC